MGRGGTGGSRGGGSHSSSSSRGGSFRSSSGSSHRSSSGSSSHRSSGFSGGGGYHSPPPPRHTVVHHYGPSYGPVYGRPRRAGCIPSLLSTIVTVIILATIMIMAVSVTAKSGSNNITASTIERQPLDKQYVTTTGDWIDDGLGWISSEYKVEQGLKEFYDETGVCPYLVLRDFRSVGYDGQAAWDYGNQIYDDIFDDEGHMVFVFVSEENSDDYVMAAVTGSMAKTVVDDEALEILYDYMDYWFNTDPSQVSEDQMFSNTFSDAAERIMHKTTNYKGIALVVVVVAIALVIAVILVKNISKARKEKAAETERILNTPIDKIGVDTDDALKNKYQDSDSV